MVEKITLSGFSDFHVHFRQGDMLKKVLPLFNFCENAVAMTNLPEPVKNLGSFVQYRKELEAANPAFNPIIAVMLTENTTPEEIAAIHEIYGNNMVLKNIPPNVSTNSKFGVRLEDLVIKKFLVLRECENRGIPFSLHAELDHSNISGNPMPERKREARSIIHLRPLVRIFNKLLIVIEHVSTKQMVNFVLHSGPNVYGTITAHHLLTDYSEVFDRQDRIIDPALYCKPVAKSRPHRNAQRHALFNYNRRFFFGSDCAPHLWEKKLGDNPAAGIFCPPAVYLPLLAELFEKYGTLYHLDRFLSNNGRRFYRLPGGNKKTVLIKEEWVVPEYYEGIKVYMGGKTLIWKVTGTDGLLPV